MNQVSICLRAHLWRVQLMLTLCLCRRLWCPLVQPNLGLPPFRWSPCMSLWLWLFRRPCCLWTPTMNVLGWMGFVGHCRGGFYSSSRHCHCRFQHCYNFLCSGKSLLAGKGLDAVCRTPVLQGYYSTSQSSKAECDPFSCNEKIFSTVYQRLFGLFQSAFLLFFTWEIALLPGDLLGSSWTSTWALVLSWKWLCNRPVIFLLHHSYQTIDESKIGRPSLLIPRIDIWIFFKSVLDQ